MRDDKKDIYDIRKQEEVLQESYMMVPDSKNRLEVAINELEKIKVNVLMIIIE
jgi:tubulin-specific chaperone A